MARSRVGLLGCGSIGGFIARHVMADAASDAIELSYVFDADEKKLQEIHAVMLRLKQAFLYVNDIIRLELVVHAGLE